MSFETLQGKLVQKGLEIEAEWSIAPASGFSSNRAMTSTEIEIFNQSMRRWAAEYARIMSPLKETPAARALANIALLESFERQMATPQSVEGWSKKGDLAKADPKLPSLQNEHYVGQPKCNLFLAEAFHEAGRFAAPQSMPSANAIAKQAQKLTEHTGWTARDPRWFDVVPLQEAQLGDILVIHSDDRIDVKTNHGHIEFIQEVVRDLNGQIADVISVGASSKDGARRRGMDATKDQTRRTTFGHYNKQGAFELHAATKIIRVRLAR